MDLIARLQQHSATIKDLLAAGGAPGLSLGVFCHGRVIYTEHFGRRDAEQSESPDDESIYWAASTFKVVTVCAVARLVTDGLLDWDRPIQLYIPEFSGRRDELGTQATIRDLIANRTGLPMATCYWGQQNGEQLLPKTEFVRIARNLPVVKPFRSTFIYSQWNYCMLHIIVEAVTGKTFGNFVRESIFEPLGLQSTTFDTPSGHNIMKPHANRNDGSPCKIKIAMFDSGSGLAAGGGAKTNLKDQLRLYIALLAAYSHQVANQVDVTPGSPFTQLRVIFSPHIRLPGQNIEKQAYCLGLYRTKLPGNLSCASLNSALPPDQLPIFGKLDSGAMPLDEEVFHHSSTTPGFMGAMFLVPSLQGGVVVHTNATSRLDSADFSAQLLLSALLNTEAPRITPCLSNAVVELQSIWYVNLATFLQSCKTQDRPTHPFSKYAGTYWNALHNFKIVVIARDGGLRLCMQGSRFTTYDLEPCDGDTFYWPASREHELVERGMWFAPFPQFHLITFTVTREQVVNLIWQHDRHMDAEQFDKDNHGEGSRL
jgi:CubicO group peptidase (beta-lactamase class C family)